MKFHLEILSKNQNGLLSFIGKFKDKFVLVGGTAIALQLGHRESIDFDLFIPNKERLPLREIIKLEKKLSPSPDKITLLDYCRTIIMNGVKITRFAYMFGMPSEELIDRKYIKIPSLIHLASMKMHAMGQRAKRKDYVDMYFLIKKFGLKEIIDYSKKFFGSEVNPKKFIDQLSYFEDINYNEKVDFMPGLAVSEEEIKKYLIEQSKSFYGKIN